MDELMMQIAKLLAPVWVLTEVLGRITKVRKDILALVLGLLTAMLGQASGIVMAPGEGWVAYAWAGLGGLCTAAVAGVVTDYVVNPTIKRGA